MTLLVAACGETSRNPSDANFGGVAGTPAGVSGRGPVQTIGGRPGKPNDQTGDAGASMSAEPAGGAGLGGAGLGGAFTGGASGTGPDPIGVGGETELPLPKDCSDSPIEVDQKTVKKCVLLSSCTGARRSPHDATRLQIGECITNGLAFSPVDFGGDAHDPTKWTSTPWGHDVRLASCPDSIATCADVLACAGFRLPIDECKGSPQAHCDGELAVNCGNNPLVTDCLKTTGKSGTCQVLGSSATAHAECIVKATCQETAGACDGNVFYSCGSEGKGYGADCSQFGQTCYTRADMFHPPYASGGCAPPLPTETCSTVGLDCVQGRTEYCSPDGKLFRNDCTVGGDFACHLGYTEPPDPILIGCHAAHCGDGSFYSGDECFGDDLLVALGDDQDPASPRPHSPRAAARIHCPDYGFETCRAGLCSKAGWATVQP